MTQKYVKNEKNRKNHFILYFCNKIMEIIINNNQEVFNAEKLSINEILVHKKYTFKLLVIKLNGTIIKKEDYDLPLVKNGDNLQIIHLMSGG